MSSFAIQRCIMWFFPQHIQHITLFPNQWEICDKILEILKFFNNATKNFSGVYYLTTHLFILESLNIVGTLDKHVDSRDSNDIILFEAVNVMKRKWLNYFRGISLLYLIATVFDPRFKLEGLNGGYKLTMVI